ncbi:MAG: hypothetical protein QXE31_00630 [Candidatus Woesearchaeota archaeon]
MITLNPNNQAISYLIDEFHSGFITGIYGNASSGKTTTCLLAAISAIKNQKKVIFIDTEKTFSIDRFNQLIKKEKEFTKNYLDYLFLLQPTNFFELHEQISKIYNSKTSKFFILIIDSISNFYKLELNKEPKKINMLMGQQIQSLIRIARDKDKIVLITNQVKADFSDNKNFKMIANKMFSNMCQTIIELNKIDDKKRQAKLIKHKLDESLVGKTIFYEIKENGIFI